MENVYEVAVYLHKFLNLDLFSQGFYAIKIRCRLDSPNVVLGVPARVVQYGQVEDGDPSRVARSFWQLEEEGKSFRSRIFAIKYARQDVLLQEMVAFNLVVPERTGPPACGIIVDFDLLHGSANKEIPQGIGAQQPPETLPTVSSHSFRIAPSACAGLHAYCALQFDTLHLALVDVTIHCALLDIHTRPASPKGSFTEKGRGTERGNRAGSGSGVHSPGEENHGPGIDIPAKVRALLVEPSEVFSHSFHEIRPGETHSPPSAKSPSKQTPFSRTLDHMLSSVVPPPNTEPPKSWRRRKSKTSPPTEVDHTVALERWSEAQAKLTADLDELRGSLAEHDVSVTSSRRGSGSGWRGEGGGADEGPMTAWEWTARVMRRRMKGLWTEFLELHREHPEAITDHLRSRWRDSRAAEWAFWTVNPDYPRSPADSFLDLRAEYEQRSRRARSRLGPGDVNSARTAELHRKGIGNSEHCLLQDLSLFQRPERHPILSTERHVAGQRFASLPRHLPIRADHDTSPSSSPASLMSSPLDSPADTSPPSSPPPQTALSLGPQLTAMSLANGAGNAELPSPVRRFFAETPPIESYEMLVQEMARVTRTGVHVVVFVHGFQGHHLDLRLIRDHWLVLDPLIEPLMSKANQDLTFDPIEDMGFRLASEVAEFLENAFGKPALARGRSPLAKLSFVGHSLGNLIIRSALTQPLLEPFLGRLHTCLSISGPHLGYLYSGNALFNSGLWFMKRFKNSACMHQLTFSDRENVRDCYLFRLSQARTLDLFKNVILVASPKDRYVPYPSARIEMCPAAIKDLKRGPAYASMIIGCMGTLAGKGDDTRNLERSQTLLRCDVNFDTTASARTLSSMLGRTAHIELLENDVYIRCLLWTHKDYFV